MTLNTTEVIFLSYRYSWKRFASRC